MSRYQCFLQGITDVHMHADNADTVTLPDGETHGSRTFLTDWVR